MDGSVKNEESLIGRIQQLERERDELRKDIEQLCLQQSGSSYLVVATRMHFQRTAGLEQEIENLKTKLAACTRDNLTLQEELSEAYHIKRQLADLHGAEVAKNMEQEKQVKFFQGCVAAAFAERDHSLMEAEKAKEKEDLMSQKLNDFQKRVDKLTADLLEEKEQNTTLQNDLMRLEEQNENLLKVINKFYDIRQTVLNCSEDRSLDDKCACLLEDPEEMWNFDDHNKNSRSKYIESLEADLDMLGKSVDNLQNKLRMGLEIEDHLRKKIGELEKKILLDEMIKNRITELRLFHNQHKCNIMTLLEEEKFQLKSAVDAIEEKISELHASRVENLVALQRDEKFDEIECRDVHITADAKHTVVCTNERNHPAMPCNIAEGVGDTSVALAQALQEKVAALLLLSQQEERHLLERNVNAALEKKLEELQRNLLQVTNEKVNALMELAQLRQEYQLLQENISHGMKKENSFVDIGEKINAARERAGKLKNLLKKTYLRRWSDAQDPKVPDHSVDFARMKIENASFRESMDSLEHLTSSIHRLHISFLKATESVKREDHPSSIDNDLNDIITEAKLMRTALSSSLPVSWSAGADSGSLGKRLAIVTGDGREESTGEKVDCVSAAGFEMVELLILAAETFKEKLNNNSSRQGNDCI